MADDLIRRSDAVRVVRDFIERPVFLQPSLYEALNAIPAAPATPEVPATRVRIWNRPAHKFMLAYEPRGSVIKICYRDKYISESANSYDGMIAGMAYYEEITPARALELLADWPEGREKFLAYCREHPPLPTPEPPPAESAADAGVTVTRELAGKIERLSKALIDMNITLGKYITDDDNLTPLQCEALRAAYMDEQVNACVVFRDLAAAGKAGAK